MLDSHYARGDATEHPGKNGRTTGSITVGEKNVELKFAQQCGQTGDREHRRLILQCQVPDGDAVWHGHLGGSAPRGTDKNGFDTSRGEAAAEPPVEPRDRPVVKDVDE